MRIQPVSVLRTSVPESVIQERLLLALQARGIFAFPIPNHGKKAKGRNRYNIVQRGHVNGVPDVAIVLPRGGMLWVELKSAKGTQSDDQKKIEARLTALGHTYLLARDWTTVVEWLRERGYLN